MHVGATAGGTRATAVVLWNRGTDVVRSGYTTPQPGDEKWLVKFAGVSGGRVGTASRLRRNRGRGLEVNTCTPRWPR